MFLALGTVACGGAVVPGILKAMQAFGLFERETGFGKKQIRNALNQLRKEKLAEIGRDSDGEISVKLTTKGKRRVLRFSIEAVQIKKSARWDGKWRILIFDIPTKPKIYNLTREALRRKIKDLGFYQMQKSVWAYPYDFEDEILFIAEVFEVQKHIEILTVEKLLHDASLKNKFNL